MRALADGLALSSLDRFYTLARSILVKSETFYDQYDQAFAACFEGIETPVEIADEVWDWLSDPLTMPGLSEAEKRELLAHDGGPRSRRAQAPVRGAPGRAGRGPPRRQPMGRHRRYVAVRSLRVPPRRHPCGRREPRPQRRESRRGAPLPRLPHRREGRRAPVRAGLAPPAPAQLEERGRARRARPGRDDRGDGRQRRPVVARLAPQPAQRGQGRAAHGRRRLDEPLRAPLQPALQRRQQPDALQGPQDLLLPQLRLRLGLPRPAR